MRNKPTLSITTALLVLCTISACSGETQFKGSGYNYKAQYGQPYTGPGSFEHRLKTAQYDAARAQIRSEKSDKK